MTREELLAEYLQCDAVLYPSLYEGFGYVVAEGMTCGKAVITCGGTLIDEILLACGDDPPRADGSVSSLVAVIREMAARPGSAGDSERAWACIAREFSTTSQTRHVVKAYEVGNGPDRDGLMRMARQNEGVSGRESRHSAPSSSWNVPAAGASAEPRSCWQRRLSGPI